MDIVITGRVTDAAVVCGPAAWHHGWTEDDWDALAGAVVAGHVIECGTQATGGNYSFFQEVPGLVRPGFPWAEVAADGSSIIGKHDGTGGQVSVGTVTSQLLYEIGSPAYLGPDVTARFDTIELTEHSPDRVRISGTKGEPPPATLKVAMNELGGYRNDMAIALTGLDVEAKAALVEKGFWAACPYARGDFASVTTSLVRTDKPDPASNEEAVALWRLTVKDPDERKVENSFVACLAGDWFMRLTGLAPIFPPEICASALRETLARHAKSFGPIPPMEVTPTGAVHTQVCFVLQHEPYLGCAAIYLGYRDDGLDVIRRVYEVARTIPPGKTMTYGEIARRLGAPHESREVVSGFFDLTYVQNSGAAFGLFASVDSSVKAIVLNSVAVLVFLIVSAYAIRSSHKSVRLQVGLALIVLLMATVLWFDVSKQTGFRVCY